MINRICINHEFALRFLSTVTHTSGGYIYILYTVILLIFFYEGGYDIIRMGLIAYAFQVPVYFSVKNLVKRKRPFLVIDEIKAFINPPDKYSFPSGHSASAMLVTLIINNHMPSLSIYFIIWMLVIFLSRVSLGLHYLSDVIFGIVLGATSYFISNFIIGSFL